MQENEKKIQYDRNHDSVRAISRRMQSYYRTSYKETRMIQIAESKKMKVAIENMLKKLDPKALTPEGKIKTYKISKDDLDYNPMGGLLVKIVINNDDKLVLSTTIQEDATTGKYEETYFGKTEELSDLLTNN